MNKLYYELFKSSAMVMVLLLVFGCTPKVKELGNIYRYPIPAKIKGFDPVLSDDLYSHIAIKQIYEPLLQYHFLKRPYELEPCLAESLPTISENRLVYTFKLKKGVYFQNNPCFKDGKREMVAEDVVYSIKRVADIKNKSTGWWIFDGRIKGLNEFREKTLAAKKSDYSLPVSGLLALDKYTLQITLTKPCPQMLYFFTMSYCSVVPKEAVELYGEEFLNNPVGTGPYMLVDWVKGLRLVYSKNQNFRKEYYPSTGSPGDKENGLLKDAGMQLPFLDTLIMTVFVESQPKWLNFMKAKLDVSSIPKDNYNQAVNQDLSIKGDLAAKGISLDINPSLDLTYTSFNMEDSIIGTNIHLRRAMSYAWNVETVIDLLYNNRAILSHSPIPPGLLGYDATFVNPYQKYDTDLAREELVKAGFPNGKDLPALDYLTTDNTTSRQWSDKFIKEMGEVGIKITITTATWPEFLNKLKNKQYQIAGAAWAADYPDPENFLQLLYGPNEAPGTNNANFKNKEYDSLYEQLILTEDEEQKKKLILRMKEIFAEELPWIPGTHRLSFGLRYNWIKNYKYNDISYGNFKYMGIDVEKRNNYLTK